MKSMQDLMPSTLGSYAGGRAILHDGAVWFYRGPDGVRHRLLALSPTTAALADAQDVKLVWDAATRSMAGTSCGRPLLTAAHL
jgi:hypothetical protein